MDRKDILSIVDHTLLAQTATWEEIKEILDDAIKYENISYDEILFNKLEVVDLNAITLCQSNKINLIIFNMDKKNAIIDVVKGKKIGTFVGEEN